MMVCVEEKFHAKRLDSEIVYSLRVYAACIHIEREFEDLQIKSMHEYFVVSKGNGKVTINH